MQRLRAGWLSFRRIHLAALIADWRRTLLSVIGVALGVTVVLGTLILKSELVRPFDSFGPSLTHAADVGVVEVTPNVSGRLPIETVNRLRAEVAGAEAVIPIVAGLTPVDVAGGTHGFFLLGGSCQIELLVGSFNCEQRARDEKPADGPGVPLQIPTVIAQRHGLQLGDELRIPGLPPGSAHLGSTFPEFDRVEGINDGYVLLAPSADIAASLLSSPGYATAAFVLPRQGARDHGRRRPRHRRRRNGRPAPAAPAGHIRSRHTESQPDRAGRHHHRRPHRREHDPVGRGGPAGGDGNDRRDRRQAGWVVRRDAR